MPHTHRANLANPNSGSCLSLSSPEQDRGSVAALGVAEKNLCRWGWVLKEVKNKRALGPYGPQRSL